MYRTMKVTASAQLTLSQLSSIEGKLDVARAAAARASQQMNYHLECHHQAQLDLELARAAFEQARSRAEEAKNKMDNCQRMQMESSAAVARLEGAQTALREQARQEVMIGMSQLLLDV